MPVRIWGSLDFVSILDTNLVVNLEFSEQNSDGSRFTPRINIYWCLVQRLLISSLLCASLVKCSSNMVDWHPVALWALQPSSFKAPRSNARDPFKTRYASRSSLSSTFQNALPGVPSPTLITWRDGQWNWAISYLQDSCSLELEEIGNCSVGEILTGFQQWP